MNNKFKEFLKSLTSINCLLYACQYCFRNEDGWPDCEKGDRLRENKQIGYFGDNEKIKKCPYFKEKIEIKTLFDGRSKSNDKNRKRILYGLR